VIVIRLRGCPPPGVPPALYASRVGGHDVLCDVAIPHLAVGSAQTPAGSPPAAVKTEGGPVATCGEVFRGPAWLCGSTREVICGISEDGYELSVGGVGEFRVAPDGSAAVLLSDVRDPTDPTVAEAALGPVLVLALALRGTFCLHASAVASEQGAMLVLGESGAGKSTLAAHLTSAGGTLASLTDDVTPFVASAAGVEVRPHFPQLKLSGDRQPACHAPAQLPLRAAYVLEPPEDGEETVSVERLDQPHAAAALLRHTVAVRLFGRELLASYLAALAAAPRLPVTRLRYPRRLDVLPAVAATLAADLALSNSQSPS
jgi:hypothetical protein